MKKICLLVGLICSLSACKRSIVDPVFNCEKAANDWSTAVTAYALDFNNSSKCLAAKKAGQSLINNCASTLLIADRKAAEASLASLKCD